MAGLVWVADAYDAFGAGMSTVPAAWEEVPCGGSRLAHSKETIGPYPSVEPDVSEPRLGGQHGVRMRSRVQVEGGPE